MTTYIGSFRVAIRDTLKAALAPSPYSIPTTNWVDGMVESAENRDVGCVWSVGFTEWPEDVQLEQMTVHARVFYRRKQRFDPEVAVAPIAAFEELLEAMQQAVQPLQGSMGQAWYTRAVEGEIDLERQFVEITVIGTGKNPGTLASA